MAERKKIFKIKRDIKVSCILSIEANSCTPREAVEWHEKISVMYHVQIVCQIVSPFSISCFNAIVINHSFVLIL